MFLEQEDGKMELCSHIATPYSVTYLLDKTKVDEFLARIILLDVPSVMLSRH